MQGEKIQSYYTTKFHKKVIMPVFDHILMFGRIFSPNPYSIFGKAVNMIGLLKKDEGN